jgi:site-specific DNA recombinase
MRIRRRGVEMRIVVEDKPSASRVDLPLLKVAARAWRWSDDLLSGRVRSLGEIAKRERVTGRYVRRLIRLGFLAPKIVEAIVEGRQSPDLTALSLTQRVELSLLWSVQEQTLGLR